MMKVVSAIGMHAAHVRRYLSYYFSPNTHLTGEGRQVEHDLRFAPGDQSGHLRRADVDAVEGELALGVQRASVRLASDPVDRSSTTSTSCPSASSRSTRVEPMNPAPPVTSIRVTPRPAPPPTPARRRPTPGPARR